MSTPGITAPAPYRYSPLSSKPLTGLPYIRKHFYIPEVIPLVGVGLCSLGMAVYFSQGGARKNDIQWQLRARSWFQNPTERTHRDGAGGVREMIQKELR
ncbi:hypothetical protein FRC11_008458, partial [Ceratobasidium sp. 423]